MKLKLIILHLSLIKRVFLFYYTKGDKRGWEESPKKKLSSKVVDVIANNEGTNNEYKGSSKGKCQHIIGITWGVPRGNIPSKGTMKRKMVELRQPIRKIEALKPRSRKNQCSSSRITRNLNKL